MEIQKRWLKDAITFISPRARVCGEYLKPVGSKYLIFTDGNADAFDLPSTKSSPVIL
jgi:hypothetical protein